MALYTKKKVRIPSLRKDIDIFSIAYLLKHINEELPDNPRTMQTLHKWEKDGVLPKALWIIKGRRYYAWAEIEAIVDTLKEVYPIQGKKGDKDKLTKELNLAVKKARNILIGAEER